MRPIMAWYSGWVMTRLRPVGEEADVLGDGHPVVVEHDDELVGVEMDDVVEGFEARAGGHGAVADHGDGPGVHAAARGALGDAEGNREAGAGVAGGEGVVGALARLAEPGEPALEADVLERVAPARHQLVGVALVGRVPDDAVDGAVEDAVEGQGELNDAEVRGQVPATLRDHGDDGVAHLLCDLRQLLVGQRLQIARPIDLVQQLAGHWKLS